MSARPWLALLLAVLVLGSVLTLKLWGSPRRWARIKMVAVDLDSLAQVQVPHDWSYDPDSLERTGDSVGFPFRCVHAHHLNGMTSYSEEAAIYLLAPDLDAAAFSAQLPRGPFDHGKLTSPVSISTQGPLTLQSATGRYERDPVYEDTWNLRLVDPDARLVITWWGFQKQYTLADATANLLFLRTQLHQTGDLAAYLQRFRSYDTARDPDVRDRNIAAFNTALRELGMPPAQTGVWTRHGGALYLIDQARPQCLHVARLLGQVPKPDHPLTLRAPATIFQWVRGTWWQDNQGQGGGLLPAAAQTTLAAEVLTDPTQVYLWRIHSFPLWGPPTSGWDARDLLRAALADGDALQHQFIAGTLFSL